MAQNSPLLESPPCPQCGHTTRLIAVVSDTENPSIDMRSFACTACGEGVTLAVALPGVAAHSPRSAQVGAGAPS